MLKRITEMHNILNVWRMRNIILERRTNANNLNLKTDNLRNTKKYKKLSLGTTWIPKLSTKLCNCFEEGGVKNVSNAHVLNENIKLIPLHLVKQIFGINVNVLTIQKFLHFFHFINNFFVTGAGTFLLLLLFHLPFC